MMVDVLQAIERVCESDPFRRSPRLRRFLKFITQQALDHPNESIKEYAIATTVYDKDPSFDPRIDPIVRVEASRLRLRLMEYYAGPGRNDETVIVLRKGTYLPTFSRNTERESFSNRLDLPGQLPSDSVIVLPFVNDTGDSELDYLSDGLGYSLTAALSESTNLRVIPFNVARNFRRGFNPRSVADEVGVRTLLAGAIQRRKSEIRAQIELIDGAQNRLVWSKQYRWAAAQRELIDDDLPRLVAHDLHAMYGLDTRKKPRPASIAECSRHYAIGRFFWNKRSVQGLNKAVTSFRQALEADPTFAPAYAGLADSYIALGTFGILPPHLALPRASAAALRALEIEPEMAEACVSLATAKAFYERNWEGAGRDYRQALKIAPDYATGHQWYGCFLFAQGAFEDAIVELKTAQELDPLSLMISAQFASGYFFAGEYDAARNICETTLELDPQFWVARWFLGMTLEQMGQLDAAIEQLDRAVQTSNRSVLAVSALGHAYALAGREQNAKELLAELGSRGHKYYVPAYAGAVIEAGLGNGPASIKQLNAACEEASPLVALFVAADPRLNPLRSAKEFASIVKWLRIPQPL
jgi:tetratricopeptide (TPR) repeat protein